MFSIITAENHFKCSKLLMFINSTLITFCRAKKDRKNSKQQASKTVADPPPEPVKEEPKEPEAMDDITFELKFAEAQFDSLVPITFSEESMGM